MTIKKRFRFNGWISLILGLSIIALYTIYSVELSNVNQKKNHAEALIHNFLLLSITTDSYMHHDIVSLESWENEFATFIDGVDNETPMQETILHKLTFLKEILIPCHNVEYHLAQDDACVAQTHSTLIEISNLLDENYTLVQQESTQIHQLYKYFILGFVIIVSISLTLMTLRNTIMVLRPLNQLQEGVNAISQGQYDYRLKVDEENSSLKSSNEFGQLAITFNQMATELERGFSRLEKELLTNRYITEQLQENDQLLEKVLNTNPNMIYVFNHQGRLVIANQPLAQRYNMPLDELIGKTDEDLMNLGHLDPQSAQKFFEDDMDVIQSQQTKFIPEEKVLSPSGEEFWYQTTLTPFNLPGKPPMGLGVSVNITDRKKIEQEILSMNATLEARVAERTDELEKANEELQSFAYSISHDLRAPLRAIDGFSRMVLEEQEEELSSQTKRYLTMLRENAVMMGKLIKGLLEFSRKGHQALNLENVDPKPLVENVLLDLQHEFPDHPGKVIIKELPNCTADPILLNQVFQNLIGNAFKFSSKVAAPVIEIGSEIMDNQNVYYVKDNGVGFDMKYAERLFGVFQRLHHLDDFKGTGVGLAIAQRIIHRHGGKIWVNAQVNNGATFYFTIYPDSAETDTLNEN